MVNFDNSATSFPKPKTVRNSVVYALNNYGGNAGRGGHSLSMATSEAIYSAREVVADFFDASAENVIFTQNCTHALNTAIFGTVKQGDHVVISNLEHNSVSRVVHHLYEKGVITYTIFEVSEDDESTINNFISSLKPNTKVVVTTIGSNVTGQILPFKSIGDICKQKDICYIADGSQGSGVVPISLKDDSINILCTSGHKSLYGVTSCGVLVTDCRYPIEPLMFGGTGSTSNTLEQPDFLPDRLESGTLNTIGIVSLKAGIEYVNSIGINKIYLHEDSLCNTFINGIKDIPQVVVYRSPKAKYLPIVSFNITGIHSNLVGEYLNSSGFCLRAGFHCSALAHKSLNTTNGTVRFSPSIFNNTKEVHMLIFAIKKIVYNSLKTLENGSKE